MGGKSKEVGASPEKSTYPGEVYFRTPQAKYGVEVPLGDNMDDVMDDWSSSWVDQSYGPDGDGFSKGEGCEWTDERTIEYEVHIDNKSWRALWANLNTILQRMYREVQDDMNRRICAPPCHSDGITWQKVSSGAYYQRRAKLRPYPGGDVPHDWRMYDHYWHLVYTITYKYTRKCERN